MMFDFKLLTLNEIPLPINVFSFCTARRLIERRTLNRVSSSVTMNRLFVQRRFTSDQSRSMGFSSEEYGGRNISLN